MIPNTPALIYDDQCEFCRRWAARFERWDRSGEIRLIPLGEEIAATLSGRTRAQLEVAMHLVTADGGVFAGAAAVRELLRFVPWGWAARTAFRVPGAMRAADWAYRLIAARRQRIGCGGEHCTIPMARNAKGR